MSLQPSQIQPYITSQSTQLPSDIRQKLEALARQHRIVAVVKIFIDGVISSATPLSHLSILTKIKGTIRYAGKWSTIFQHCKGDKKCIQEVLEKYSSQTDVVRILEPIGFKNDPVKFISLAIHPLNQLLGFATINVKTIKQVTQLPDKYVRVLDYINQPARIRVVLLNKPRIVEARIQQGVRDDITTVSTGNPHQRTLYSILDPIYVAVIINPTPFDKNVVPENTPVANQFKGMKYIEAYKRILEDTLEFIKEKKLTPFGGRTLHVVYVEYSIVKADTSIEGEPLYTTRDIEEALRQIQYRRGQRTF